MGQFVYTRITFTIWLPFAIILYIKGMAKWRATAQKIKSLNTVVDILTTSCNTDNSVFFTPNTFVFFVWCHIKQRSLQYTSMSCVFSCGLNWICLVCWLVSLWSYTLCLLSFGAELLSCTLLYKYMKIKINRTIILLFFLYGCETWSFT
jgi:hypothetical protein